MSRALRIGLFGLVVVVTAATCGLAFFSFTRKVATFRTAGFAWDRAADALVVRSVDPEGSAQAAGLHPGDRIVLADGRTAGSLEWPEKDLARRPLPHHLVVISGGAISAVSIGEPAVRPDYTYLFLAFVGLLYLVIGLFTVARERAPASRVFWALCLSSFAIYVITPAGPHDGLWKACWLAEDFFRALLPALLLHLFLIFPKPARSRRLVPLLYLPAAAYLAAEPVVLSMTGASAVRASETMTRLWFLYFVLYATVVIARLAALVTMRAVPAAEKQARWIALGVTVGLAPFVLLSAIPRALGFASPLLSTIAVVPLVFIPLAFAWAILKWRLWDVEIFVREAVAATGAVLLGGMTFVLLNALLDRTLVGMAEAGKNVIAFASGLVLASLLVPVKRRLTDALEKIQYRETYRARRALLEVARDFSAPRPKEELVHAIVRRVEEGLHVVPCSLFLFGDGGETPESGLLSSRLEQTEVWRLRASAFGELEHPAARHLHAMGYRTFFAMRSGGKLAGALGVGHKDGRVPLSSEDESLLRAVMAQAGLAYENARLYGALADRLEEIRALQQYQESVIQSSSSGIVVLDAADHVHSANPAFAQLVGRGEADLVGLPFSEVLPGVEPGPAPEGGGETTLEARFAGADGIERDLRVSVSLLRGEPERRVLLVDDVTDRLAVERAVAERERLASLGILAAGVAHEVNTPIAGLSSYAQLLLAETPPGDPRYAILKKMERQTFRAAHLVNNLLEFARPRSRAKSRMDLRTVLADAAESVETSFGARKLTISSEGSGGPVEVLADPREIEQVFINLLTNARDASPEGGTIVGGVSRENGMARVTISDRGAGVSSEAGEKLFQPFFTTKKSGGMGLGLAISRDIVRRYGGEIGLAPREGGGTVAWVTLPLAAPAPGERPS